MGSGTVACKINLLYKHDRWLNPVHSEVSWNFTIGFNEKTTLSSKKPHMQLLILERSKKASEQSFYVLLYKDENRACNHKKTTCIIMAYIYCTNSWVAQHTTDQVKMMEPKHLILLLGKVVSSTDNTM